MIIELQINQHIKEDVDEDEKDIKEYLAQYHLAPIADVLKVLEELVELKCQTYIIDVG